VSSTAYAAFLEEETASDNGSEQGDTVISAEAEIQEQKEAAIEDPEDPEEPEEEQQAVNSLSSGGSSDSASVSSFNNVLSSFQTDLYTGKASLSVPIEVPAGRRGIQPNLNLIYQSGGPNTWCGLGWMLDTGSIQRSTKRGVPEYNSTDTFVFNFNGSSQELVDIGSNEYRAKIESVFMKFEFSNNQWIVTDSKGTKYYFGQADSSRQKKESGEIFSWYLDKVIDLHGNYMTLEYEKDQNQIYPDLISYTANDTTGDSPKYTVTFNREDRDDERISYRSGIKVTTAKRLSQIAIKYNGSLVRRYDIAYADFTDTRLFSLIESIVLYGSDQSTSLPAITFTYQDLNPSFSNAQQWTLPWASGDQRKDSQWWSFIRAYDGSNTISTIIDINGDGLPDKVMRQYSTPYTHFDVQLNNGSGFDEAIQWGPLADFYDKDVIEWTNDGYKKQISLFDINGDSLPDRVYYMEGENDKYRVQLNNGHGFESEVVYWTNIGGGSVTYNSISATDGNPHGVSCDIIDMNGDGLVDKVMTDGCSPSRWNGIRIQLNDNIIPPNYLTQVSNGLGATTSITYKPYKGADNTAQDEKSQLPFPVWVVDTITSTDSVTTNSYTTTYEYDSGIYNSEEREFRGFGYVKVTDHGNNYTETYFEQGDIFKGKIKEQKACKQGGEDYTKTVTTWATEPLNSSKTNFPYASQIDSYIYEGGAEVKHTQSTTTYTFSDNLIDTTTATEEGDLSISTDDRSTVSSFCHNTSDWIVNVPYETELRDSSSTAVSKQRIYYDSQSLGVVGSKGLPTTQSVWLDTPTEKWISSTTVYNNYGNVTSTTDPRGNSITTAYETTLNQYPDTITNALGHTQSFTYDYKTGQILTSTDPNGEVTTNVYDALGRLKEIYGPLDTDSIASVIYEYNLTSAPSKITKKVKEDYSSSDYITTYTFTDGFGRALEVKSPAVGGQQIISGIAKYDYRGKVTNEYKSYFVTQSSDYVTPAYSNEIASYGYDYLGRVTGISAKNEAGGSIAASNTYTGWQVTSLDFKGNQKDSFYDAYGRLIKVREHNQGSSYDTDYEYDTQGNLTKVTDSAGNITTINYDSLGRKTSMVDPDMGTWEYTYDDNGNLKTQTDNKGQVIQFDYDELNRLTQKLTPDETVAYAYDTGTNGTGRLASVSYGSGTTAFTYDELGREVATTKTVSSTDYTIQRTYDAMDRLKTLTYPDSEVLTYTYDASGAVKTIVGLNETYVSDIIYNAQGQMKTLQYGNGTITTYTYNTHTQRLTNLLTQKSGTDLQDIDYEFDRVGNVSDITDNVYTATQSFVYDDLNRLTQATNTNGYGILNYDYSSIGNLTQKGNLTLSYAQTGNAGPHAVTSYTPAGQAAVSITYDANGNMTAKGSTTYEYDSENRLTRVVKPGDSVHDTYEIELKQGWNFFSLPVIPDGYSISDSMPISAVLSTIDGYYSQVTRYNPETDLYESYVGDPEADQFSTMEYLRGYQIYCDSACTLTITGSSPSTSFSDTLPVGDNLVGVDISNNGKTASAAFFDIAYSTIKWYNPATSTLEDVDGSDTVYMGRCYWLDITASSTYSVTSIQATTTFTYDGDGGRVKKTIDGHTTTYIGSLFEKESGTETRHIFLGDTRICSAVGNSSYNFYHGDHLGSTSDVTDKNGELIQHTEYTPYGEFSPSDAVTEPRVTQYAYTGQLFDESTELYYYGARYYDPQLGRFITADTIVPDPTDPQAFDRYGYARGNPIRYTDPTGHSFWDKIKDWIGHAVGAFCGAVATVVSGNLLTGMQIYSFVSSAINSAINGDIGAFAIGTATSLAFSGFIGGIRDSVASATSFLKDAPFLHGFVVGAVEGAVGGFVGGFVSEYARTGSGSAALKGGAWGAAIGAPVTGLAVGSYNAGMQNKIHAWDGDKGSVKNMSDADLAQQLSTSNEKVSKGGALTEFDKQVISEYQARQAKNNLAVNSAERLGENLIGQLLNIVQKGLGTAASLVKGAFQVFNSWTIPDYEGMTTTQVMTYKTSRAYGRTEKSIKNHFVNKTTKK